MSFLLIYAFDAVNLRFLLDSIHLSTMCLFSPMPTVLMQSERFEFWTNFNQIAASHCLAIHLMLTSTERIREQRQQLHQRLMKMTWVTLCLLRCNKHKNATPTYNFHNQFHEQWNHSNQLDWYLSLFVMSPWITAPWIGIPDKTPGGQKLHLKKVGHKPPTDIYNPACVDHGGRKVCLTAATAAR